MKKQLFIIALCLLSFPLFSQLNTFRLTYDVGAFDITGGMVETSAKEYVITGLNNSFGPYYGNAMKIDSAGTILWAKAYTGGFATNFSDIKQVSTGGYIMTGSSTSGGGGALLVRIDASGNILWAKRYQYPDHPTGNASSEFGNAVMETSDGGFLVGGGVDYFWDGASATTVDTTNAMAFKTDASGTLIWNKVWTLTNPTKVDEHFINDVAESADGYFFVGESADETQAYDSDGDLPRDALLIKTDKAAGTTTYIRRWGHGGSSSQGINAAITLSTGNILLGGYDDVHGFLVSVSGTGAGTPSVIFNRRLNGNAFGNIYLVQDIMEGTDGNYSIIGTQFAFLAVAFNTMIVKINSTTTNLIFGRAFAPIGLSAILPEGGQCANGGYYISMTDQQAGGFNYNIMRTNTVGQLGAGPAGCNSTTLSPALGTESITFSTPASSEYTTAAASSFSPAVTNITPVKTQDCFNVACSKPAATVSASPTTICAGQNTTITATGGTSYSWSTGATTSSIVVAPTNNTAYTATVTAGGCDSIPAPVTVTVTALPNASISGNTTICQGQSTTLTASGGGTYAWNTGPTSASITVSPTTPTTYTVTVTGAGGCTKTATSAVTVNTTPTPSVTATTQTVCSGSTTTLTASGGGTYSWSTGATTNPIIVSPTSPTTYTVTASNGNCSSTTTITISTNSLPTASISSGSANICAGDIATLTASGGGTYSWNTGATTSVINPAPTVPTSYTVTVTNTNGCTDTATFNVNVLAPPVASVAGNNTICAGQSTTLTASGGGNYSWNTGATTSSISVSPTTGTNYTVTVSAGSCSDAATYSVTVNPSPNANINTASTSICAGQNATLTATGGGTYSWSTGVTTNPIIVSPTAPTSYTVIVSNGTCSSSATVSLTVSAPVTAGVTSTNSTICSGTNATLTASGGGTYSWTTGSTTNPITVSPTAGTTYSVIVSNGGCSDTAAVNVAVNPSPTATVSSTGNSICAGQTATLTAAGGGTYVWNTGATTATISVSPTANTNYTVVVTAANGCTAAAVTSVTVTAIPNATVSANTTICSGDAITLSASGGTTYVWSPGGQTGSSIVVNPSSSTTYTVIAANGGCTDIAVTTVSVNPSPAAGAGPDITISYGNGTTLNGSGGGTYSWNTGTTTSSIAVAPTVTTSYTLVVTDANGCTGADVVTVIVDYNCGEVFVPNAFSPNGDVKNDVLRVRSPCLKAMHFIIYDRWGRIAFETSDITQGWDGMYKGEMGNTAVFFYTLNYELVTGSVGELKGSVTLVR